MPPRRFLNQVKQYGLDVLALKIANDDTLAGVARHLRDFVIANRPFYFCRFDIVKSPKVICPNMSEAVERIGGYCIRVVDVVRSASINIQRRRGGALPSYNLPAHDHYRILNPVMNKYIEESKAVFFSVVEGSSSDEHGKATDIFGD